MEYKAKIVDGRIICKIGDTEYNVIEQEITEHGEYIFYEVSLNNEYIKLNNKYTGKIEQKVHVCNKDDEYIPGEFDTKILGILMI